MAGARCHLTPGGSFSSRRVFVNTLLTSDGRVRRPRDCGFGAVAVTVSGVHACEAAVRCRAVGGRWARRQASEAIIGAQEAADPADT